jgi:hypothetical protein
VSDLATQKCKPCEGGVAPYTAQQAKEKLQEARVQRADGKITEKQWQEAFDRYAVLAEKAT